MNTRQSTRRHVLRSMIAAPVLAGIAATRRATGQDTDVPIASADQALDVFDFERVARATLPPAHLGYLATGVDGDETLEANRAGFANYGLRDYRVPVRVGRI